jgi:hypothetical protein
MIDTVFRSPVEPSPVKEVEISKPQPDVHESTIEGPYTDYEKQHNHPYVVDHFDLGSMWNIDGVYTDEVKTIEGYLSHQINLGMANDKKAVQETLKKLEKMAGIEKTDRTVVKVGKLSSYVKFLNETENIKTNTIKYG